MLRCICIAAVGDALGTLPLSRLPSPVHVKLKNMSCLSQRYTLVTWEVSALCSLHLGFPCISHALEGSHNQEGLDDHISAIQIVTLFLYL